MKACFWWFVCVRIVRLLQDFSFCTWLEVSLLSLASPFARCRLVVGIDDALIVHKCDGAECSANFHQIHNSKLSVLVSPRPRSASYVSDC